MMDQWLVRHLDQDCYYAYFLPSTLIFILLLCGCVEHQVWRPEEPLWSGVCLHLDVGPRGQTAHQASLPGASTTINWKL